MTSKPLFIKVAESIVILAPMDQFGCAKASSTVTSFNSSLVLFLKDPPEHVINKRFT